MDEESDEEELDNSYTSDKEEVNMGDDDKKKKHGVKENDDEDKIIVFKRMSDIFTLNQKYFKEKAGPRDVRPELADDMFNTVKKNE